VTQDEQELIGLLAYFYLQNGRAEKAEILLTALDILVPNQTWTLSTLAYAQIRANHPDLSLKTLDRLAMIGRMDAFFHLMRMQALTAQNRPEEAEQARQIYLSLRSGTAELSAIEADFPPSSQAKG
jgi:predicted Zn-dependent protease